MTLDNLTPNQRMSYYGALLVIIKQHNETVEANQRLYEQRCDVAYEKQQKKINALNKRYRLYDDTKNPS